MKYKILTIAAVCLFLSGCSLITSSPTDTNETQIPNNGTPANEQDNKKLDLSNQNLEKIPAYIFGLKNLTELNVSNNRLTEAIQAEIKQLQNLEVLNASNNQMTGVPAEIGQLGKLRILNLSNNQLTGLPYELGNLRNLKTLNISGNNYSELDLGIILKNLPQNVTVIK